jgi:hypothetical protein
MASPETPQEVRTEPAHQEKATRREPAWRTRQVSQLHFFFVWSPEGDRPRARHETREGAVGEARRLGELHPHAAFLVYEARLADAVEPTAQPVVGIQGATPAG